MRGVTVRTQAQPGHLGPAVGDPWLRCDRGVQGRIEYRAPARHGGQVLVARLPRGIAQEAVLFHLSGAHLMYGGVHVREAVTEHGTSQPEEVVRLPKLSDTAPLPPRKHLVRGPAVERLHVSSVKHDHIMGTAGEGQRGGTTRNARAEHNDAHRHSIPQVKARDYPACQGLRIRDLNFNPSHGLRPQAMS